MNKIKVLALLFLLLLASGCGAASPDTDTPPDSVPVSIGVVDASEDVVRWAQYEIEQLIRMLEESGFLPTAEPETVFVEIAESQITNLQLEKELPFHQNGTLRLYALDFRLQPAATIPEGIFVLDEEGWIPSAHNFRYADANGVECESGQLYLLISDDGATLSSIGIRRAQGGLTDAWCTDLQAYFGYPPGVWFDHSPEALQSIMDYWAWDEEWSFTMPNEDWYDGDWSVGLGYAHEWGLGIPYEFLGWEDAPAQDLVALSFSTVRKRSYEGLTVITLDGFYGNTEEGIEFAPIQYIACTQPDCATARGISVGDSAQAVREAYPEVYPNEDCLVYAPEGTNRSILFVVRDGVVVQIDMADGLDGQYTAPAGI